MTGLRILFVVRPPSVHSARWINQIVGRGWDIHVFGAFESPWHPDFRNVTTYSYSTRGTPRRAGKTLRERRLWPLPLFADRAKIVAAHLPEHWSSRAAWLARVIRWLNPDMVHSLEFQQAGYLTLQTRALYKGRFPAWVVSNWGSDIYLYGPLAEHVEKIKGILAACDYYACECHRDVTLAREYGFTKTALPVLPVAGGFQLDQLAQYRQPGPTSARKIIALKGYQHWAGRALIGLRALEFCSDQIKAGGYTVAIYLAEDDVRIAAERMSLRTGIPIEILPPASHEEVLRLHGRSRVSIGLSISDGLSTSALEAMIMGAFPVQSNTGCLNELVKDGETALIVPPEEPVEVAAAIQRAISDDTLVDRAAESNARLAAERLDYRVIQPRVVEMYERIGAEIRARSAA
jgi:Glycosyl transferases group 1/Glycosyl transferase 4-like